MFALFAVSIILVLFAVVYLGEALIVDEYKPTFAAFAVSVVGIVIAVRYLRETLGFL